MHDLEQHFDFSNVIEDIRSGEDGRLQAAMETVDGRGWEALAPDEQTGLVDALQAAYEINPALSDAHVQWLVLGLKDSNPILVESFLQWMERGSNLNLQTRAAKLRAASVQGISPQ